MGERIEISNVSAASVFKLLNNNRLIQILSFGFLSVMFVCTVTHAVAGVKETVDYRVPVEGNPELVPFSTHQFNIKWKNQEIGQRAFKYDLPVELDGVGQKIELIENSPGVFVGPKGSATCDLETRLNCHIKYNNLAYNPTAAVAAIQKRYADAEAQAARIQVMSKFQEEPGGIMTSVQAVGESYRR